MSSMMSSMMSSKWRPIRQQNVFLNFEIFFEFLEVLQWLIKHETNGKICKIESPCETMAGCVGFAAV